MLFEFHNSHNPYFNRWFSAIIKSNLNRMYINGHNPYFNRWFSAILKLQNSKREEESSQSLF